ncbi:trypsin-like peptidase domain-containing protein [Halanaerobium sp. Z-7514]|uniref:Trypsin-like peptidase domain-containing protein n=1 Tax=Halanaerobium polyolivorans TaxID=2886943 RepID=A0AAW4X185_9FIRM|nr:trypsin-like peptidase domain-containing protein [Halanaerobium polyolivorans]MCC3145562.1 trypsin-like peptidase domain-containing protein [Halanaerobium polyolivorans]
MDILKQRSAKKLVAKLFLSFLILALVFSFTMGAAAQQSENIYQSNHFADIAEQVDNSVVKVTTTAEVSTQRELPDIFDDPYFRFFFGDRFQIPDQGPREQQGFGSGFIVSEEGYILTNQHVIQNSDKVEVEINNIDDPLKAEVIWSDFSLDLAVLKVETDQDLSAVSLGDSDKIRPGDWAIAIGNPFGFEHTVTVGVISALGRPIQIPTESRQVRTYQNLIQLDAAINPGNSGGPLLNNKGEVIGINTAVSAAGQGIGFAIPINEAKGIITQLKETGEITQPWIGIAFSNISSEMQSYFKLENREGVIVIEVYEDSPAEEAGLENYDVIKEIDRQKIESTSDVAEIIRNKEVGEEIMFKITRDGSTEILFGIVGDKPSDI